MGLVIRAAVAADIPAITAIYDHAVRHGTASFELDPPDAAEMARRRQAARCSSIEGTWAESPMTAGFRLIGTVEHVGHKLGRWLDTVLMQRPLGPGASSPP
jgi:L-amino acid N-acyltransferase YncA